MRGMKQWFRDLLPKLLYRWGEFISLVQRVREKVARVVNWAAGPALCVGFLLFSWLAYDAYSGLGKLAGGEMDRALEWLKFYAYLVGGIVLMWQVRISDRRATALEKTAALGEKGNITERFKNAIEHLTHSSEAVRIGGIHTLYHIAREASEYKEAVVGILTVHLREKLSSPKYAMRIRIVRDEYGEEKIDMPTNEVMAILHAFFPEFYEGETMPPFLLGMINLSELNLHGALLDSRRMDCVHAEGVNLSRADLLCSSFEGAILSHANFRRATLGDAHLDNALVDSADFRDAVMYGVDLWGSHLDGSNFTRANLRVANLGGTSAINVAFDEADCRKADFSGADLTDSTFWGTELREAVITVEQLLRAKTLYGATLDAHIREEILRRKPELLDPPAETRQ